jgi:hypothetical protein
MHLDPSNHATLPSDVNAAAWGRQTLTSMRTADAKITHGYFFPAAAFLFAQ